MAAILFFWLCNDSVSGQLAPGAAYVFPPVVRIGETTEVRMGVLDPTDDLQWFVHDERVELEVVGPVSDFFAATASLLDRSACTDSGTSDTSRSSCATERGSGRRAGNGLLADCQREWPIADSICVIK